MVYKKKCKIRVLELRGSIKMVDIVAYRGSVWSEKKADHGKAAKYGGPK